MLEVILTRHSVFLLFPDLLAQPFSVGDNYVLPYLTFILHVFNTAIKNDTYIIIIIIIIIIYINHRTALNELIYI